MKHSDPEYIEQCIIARHLDNHPDKPLWTASAGGMRTSIGTAIKMKNMGYKKGTPDIFIFESKYIPAISGPGFEYKGLVIEFKTEKGIPYQNTKKGVPSKEQLQWIKELEYRGYYAVICYGSKQAIFVIDNYLNNKVYDN